MKDRLIRLLDSEQLTASKFADRIGVQRSSVSHVLSGRNKPSFDFIEKTLKAFPDLNPEWLILGKGDMITGIPDYTGGTLFDQVEREPPMKKSAREESGEDVRLKVRAGTEEEKELREVPEEREVPAGLHSERKVMRVVLLYDDHTFAAYDPSE